MRASLVSRELIADSIELMDIAHDFDALVCIVGCDKTVPAALMALARIDKPAVVIYSGPMRAGRWRGERATIQDVWEAVGARRQGKLERAELDDARARGLPRARAPAPGTSPRTRWGSRSSSSGSRCPARRWSPPTSSSCATSTPPQAGALAVRLAETAVRARLPRPARAAERVHRDRRQRRVDQRRAAHARDLPRGRRRARRWTTCSTTSRTTPVIASLTPGGRYVATEFQEAGGVPVLIRELIRAGLRRRRRADRGRRERSPTPSPRRPTPTAASPTRCAQPYKRTSGLCGLRGNLAPDGAVAKVSGVERRAPHRPGARVRQRGRLHRGDRRPARSTPATC